MFKKVKENWQQLKDDEPGRRFQHRYEKRQQESHGKFSPSKIFNIVGGIVITAAGLFLIPAPGPGSLITFVGLGLIGSEFGPMARFMDGAEVRLRKLAEKGRETWANASLPVKILIGLIVLSCLAAVGYGLYQWFFGSSKR